MIAMKNRKNGELVGVQTERAVSKGSLSHLSRRASRPRGASRSTRGKPKQWQQANRAFWENHPMRYDWTQPVALNGHSLEFFAEVDSPLSVQRTSVHALEELPFETLIDFSTLRSMDVA